MLTAGKTKKGEAEYEVMKLLNNRKQDMLAYSPKYKVTKLQRKGHFVQE